MKINILLLILVLTATFSYGQIKFENGYLIDNENFKQECLIKNQDWWNNPSEFDYKVSGNDTVKKGNMFSVKEFGITHISKFIRVHTKIDRSSVEITTLSTMRNPEWSEERLFLKVLIEGKASLYQYRERNSERYFYSVSDSSVKQLIYKEYYAKGTGIAYNNDFRQQLLNDVRNAETKMRTIENISYTQDELERYFRQFNKNEHQPALIYNNNKNRDFLVLRITPGINYSSFSVTQNIFGPVFTNTDHDLSFRIGMEADFILPFNKNKWEIIFDPSFQYFNSSTEDGSNKVDIYYKWIEFPIGIRYNFYLNDYLKIFLNGFFVPHYAFDINSTVDVTFVNSKYYQNFNHNNSLALGVGFGYEKLSMEFRYNPNSDLYRTYIWTDYQLFSLIFGYTLFKLNHK
jgi:hypothetical protein